VHTCLACIGCAGPLETELSGFAGPFRTSVGVIRLNVRGRSLNLVVVTSFFFFGSRRTLHFLLWFFRLGLENNNNNGCGFWLPVVDILGVQHVVSMGNKPFSLGNPDRKS